MYSRKTAEGNGLANSIPPHYGGTRFGRRLRSDGREEITDLGLLPIEQGDSTACDGASYDKSEAQGGEFHTDEENSKRGDKSCEEKDEHRAFTDLFSGLGEDDLLIIALIILLATEREDNREIILLLVFLLAAGR